MGKYYLGIDQGTTGTTALLFDASWKQVARGYKEHRQYYPRPGWVEHDPVEIWSNVLETVSAAIKDAGISHEEIMCIGVNNQGETVMLWDKVTGLPVYNAIVWQDRRTAKTADELSQSFGQKIREKTGLIVDAYFSATKLMWLIENVPDAKEKIAEGRILAGTLDSWMIWKMTHGKVHITDRSTASRTMLFNIHSGQWDEDILNEAGIPKSILPQVESCAKLYGYTDPLDFFGASIPISASLVDQQAALFGQACCRPGMVKTTYGTGCFMIMNTGAVPIDSPHGLLTTVAWDMGDGQVSFALDGGVYIAGAAIQWLRDGLKIIESAEETEKMALAAESSDGVFFVPAFAGLAAPHWDQYARGTIIGITGKTSREQIVRAALESIAFQVKDILDVMERDSGIKIQAMRADGGAAENTFLMQFQADILGIPVDVPVVTDSTALGAAYMAAYGIGEIGTLETVERNWKRKKRYEPKISAEERSRLLKGWHRAVERAKGWMIEEEKENADV